MDTITSIIEAYAFGVGRYLIGTGIVFFVLNILFKRWSQRYRIQKTVPDAKVIRREILSSLGSCAVFALAGLLVLELYNLDATFIYHEMSDYPIWYTVLSLPLMFLLHDTYFYWTHRALHHPKLYKLVHLEHHKSRTPTPFTAYSFSTGEAVTMAVFFPLVTMILPLSPLVITIFLAVMMLRNAMGHAGIEFHPQGWVDGPLDVFNTTTHHDMHHQKFQGNYGLYFTHWDRWMGTELKGYKEAFREAARGKNPVCDTTTDYNNKKDGLAASG